MSYTDEHNSGQVATRRAEQMLDTIGHHLGLLAGAATYRIEQVVSNVHLSSPFQTSASRQEPDRSLQPAQEANQPAFERAEKLVQRTEQSMGDWTTRVSHQSQRMLARVREDLEDLWAEAQHLRHARQHS